MKIILAINDLGFGGGQLTVVHEANELTARGHEVYVLTTLREGGGLAERLALPKERVVHIRFHSLADRAAYRKLRAWIAEVRPDAVVSNLFFTNTILRIARLRTGIPKLLIREGNVPTEKGLGARITDFALAFLVDGVIVNAAALKRPLAPLYPGKPFFVIYNGVDLGVSTERRKEGAPVVTVVGSLTEKKGHRYLIEALGLLKHRGDAPLPRLLFVGDGPLRGALEEFAQKENVREYVEFFGASSDVGSVFSRTTILAIPSLWEGMPNVLLEGLAAGLPCVATRVGGVPEIARDGENALLVPPMRADALAEGLARLLADPALMARLGERGRETMRAFSWQKHADQLLAVL